MARTKKTGTKRPIESYEHGDKQRANNPPVGLVTPDTDTDVGAKKTCAYDPHLDPQLVWAGKVQMVYLDLRYGIRYGSNFQPFVNKRDVKYGRDEDLTAEPGEHQRITVKIVDHRAIESLKVMEVD
jgi:adenine-specific DNA-methyltransferase